MRQAIIAVLSTVLLAAPALAQDQTSPPAPIAFDLKDTVQETAAPIAPSSGIRGIRTRQQPVNSPPACTPDSDMIQAQAAGPQRYDDNGAPIRTPPTCSLDRPSVAVAQAASPTTFLREPPCEESATGYSCASADTAGRTRFAREAQCEETATTRTCSSSGSISFGSSSDGNDAAQVVLDRMFAD